MNNIKINLIGQKFNRLLVTELSHKSNKGENYWKVKCDCGIEKTVRAAALRNGSTKSCGCYSKELSRNRAIHGMRWTYLYRAWSSLKDRCYNSKNPSYHNYGDRGIIVYGPWINDFGLFKDYILSNIGERPDNYSLDRINNDGNYEPDNLRWASKTEQNNNKRQVTIITNKEYSDYMEYKNQKSHKMLFGLDGAGI